MKIHEIISQSRRDFRAIFECEHCKHSEIMNGYDDAYFHNKVIPLMKCKKCGESSPENYRELKTKYPEGMTV